MRCFILNLLHFCLSDILSKIHLYIRTQGYVFCLAHRAENPLSSSCSLGEFSPFHHHHALALRTRINTTVHTCVTLAGSQVTLKFCLFFFTEVCPKARLIFTNNLPLMKITSSICLCIPFIFFHLSKLLMTIFF